jgi:hypothetical protein
LATACEARADHPDWSPFGKGAHRSGKTSRYTNLNTTGNYGLHRLTGAIGIEHFKFKTVFAEDPGFLSNLRGKCLSNTPLPAHGDLNAFLRNYQGGTKAKPKNCDAKSNR